jgi:hypothetical protein
MPQLHTKLSERMANKRRVKPRKFMTAFDDLTKMVDVLFIGLDGEHGRRPINGLSPDQFAALMTAGANDQGVRSAMWSLSENKITMIDNPSTFN